jgi:hypothetical protein
MSGSPRIPLPTPFEVMMDMARNPRADPIDREKRKAAVLLLHALFEEFPLAPREAGTVTARQDRDALITYAERGWFVLLTKEAYLKDTGVPPDRIRAGITLLIG